jgi:hypothetical protein
MLLTPAVVSMRINYVLIDFENVQVKSLTLLDEDHFRVKVFLGPKNTKLPVELVIAVQQFATRAEYITLETSGSNALDFHIAYYLGILSASDPTAYYHIISKDTGFDPLIQHLRTKNIYSCRSASIEDMPCFAKKEPKEETPVINIQIEAKPTTPMLIKPTTTVPVHPGTVIPEKSATELDKNFKLVHEDLAKRKSARPRTIKTLMSTMQARCGKEVPSSIIDAIFAKLVKRGFVKVNGTKITYAPPES